MKGVLLLLTLIILTCHTPAQQLPNLPIPIGAGTAEVWNNNIYLFGGSDNWSGSTLYPRIYKFDGTSWAYYDSIPDNNVWDAESVIDGDNVYLIGGWPAGPSLNRRYNLTTHQWTSLAESPNTSQTWGLTAEVINGNIYVFNSNGEVFVYDIAGNSWSTKTSNSSYGSWDMSSILYNNEIYIIGWADSTFYKYSPANDSWTRLANSLYQVGACAIGDINNLIYFVGGNINGSSYAEYRSVLVYNITSNLWSYDDLQLTSKRHWMTTARFKGGLYVIGGIDSLAEAVNTVEQIVPQGTAVYMEDNLHPKNFYLSQNYPNPFNPGTTIKYEVPAHGLVTLKIFNLLGNEIATLINEAKSAGKYEISFNAKNLPSGVYFYQLKAGNSVQTRKMVLLK